jgi:uncharacterized repeat protein (TIGR02543 family)
MHTPFLQSTLVKPIFSIFIVLAIIHGVSPLHAETRLSGTADDTTFTAAGNPYIVEKDFVIPEGHTVVIGEGCRFYFKLFTGITVEGSFKVTGTREYPVLFTSINDSCTPKVSEQLPNPFDWDGIHITPKAGMVELSYFTLVFSTYGIKSQKEPFTIINGTFRRNGSYNCTKGEKILPADDDIPFTYATHAVVYDLNGAASGKAPVDTLRYNQGMPVQLPGNSGNLVKPGYAFAGWNSSSDGTGSDYGAGSAFFMGDNDVRLFAKWAIAGKPKTISNAGNGDFWGKKEVPFIIGGAGIVCGGASLACLKL